MRLLHFLLYLLLFQQLSAQVPPAIKQLFPEGTTFHQNIPYAGDTLKKHQLDIYQPAKLANGAPLVVWVHGGAWMLNDKYADMGYMRQTIRGFLEQGYILASVDYRHSTTAVFPAQLQDLNQALQFLYDQAGKYKIDRQRIGLIGFSAGGHLASLLALSQNNKVKGFHLPGAPPRFAIRCVLDFYGPSDLIAMASKPDTSVNNNRSPASLLLGAEPNDRPDLARRASPVSYVDRNDPPFLIVQGEKDESVPNTQSKLLHATLTLAGVPSQLIVVPGAPHYGSMFDETPVRERLMVFLAKYFR